MIDIRNGSLYAFIPKHLEIVERPELNVFSYNVLIAMYRINSTGKTEMCSVIYNPELETYRKLVNVSILKYFNIYNHDFRLDMYYDEAKGIYLCQKFNKEERLGEAQGKEWKLFFFHVGILGLANRENCMVQEIKERN